MRVISPRKMLRDLTAYLSETEAFAIKIRRPPLTLKGEAAKEWCRVAPRLYELNRLELQHLISLYFYCWTYAAWRAAQAKFESLKGKKLTRVARAIYSQWVSVEHTSLKRTAREFGFFLGEGGMNLELPLPTEDERAKARRRRQRRILDR